MDRQLTPTEQVHARQRANRLLEAEAAAGLLWSRRQFGIIELASYLSLGEVAQRLQRNTVASIEETRKTGRDAGIQALKRELPTLPIESRDAIAALGLYSAVVTARRYVSAWLAEANAFEGPRILAAQSAAQAVKSRAQTIVITETSQAFSLSRRKAVTRAARRADVVILERWDATLDHSTCPICEFADGETIRLGDDFSEGIPGGVHARCRCTSHYLYETPETAWLLTS
jgi:hypothetical protein